MKNNIVIYLFTALVILVVFNGCEDKEDHKYPRIIIESPSENSQYKVGESIAVKALITDNEIVESVEIHLNKLSNNAKVGESQLISVGSAVYNLKTSYLISDTLLPTDDYYLTITAFDGNLIGKSFQKIKISGLPKKKLSDIIVVSDGILSSVVELKNKNLQNTVHTFNSDHGGAVFSSKNQMIYFCGEVNNKLYGFDMKTSTESWVKTYSSPPNAVTFNYLDIGANENNIGISLANGYTDVLSHFGSEVMNFQLNVGMVPYRHFMEKKVTFIETFSHNKSVHKMEVFYSSTSAPFDNKNINFQIINAFEVDESKAFIFANLNGSANRYEYTYSSKIIRTADNLMNDSLINVVQIDNSLFLVASKNKLYKYFLPSSNLIELLNGVRAEVMAYDQLHGEIYIGNGSVLYIYDYSSGNLKTTISLPAEIKNIFFRYNI